MAAVELVQKLEKEGIQVDNLITIDPVKVTGDIDLNVPSNVKSATNYYHQGEKKGPTDFQGTPLNGGSNVDNQKINPKDTYIIFRHENMPMIAFKKMAEKSKK